MGKDTKKTDMEAGACEFKSLRGRRGSRVLFWYIAREFLIPLACCIGGFIALFLVFDVFDVLRDFVEARSSISGTIMFFVLRQPANLVNVLPMSILLSASFMVHMLGRHHEITAMRAGGLCLVRCCLPVWLAAVALSGVSLWLNESIAPQSSARAEELLDEMTTSAQHYNSGRIKLAFRNVADNRDWFFEAFSRDGEKKGVLVKQFRDDRTVQWELQALSTVFEAGQWVFHDAVLVKFDGEGALPVGPEKKFDRYVAIGLEELPEEILSSLRPAEELSIREMRRMLAVNQELPQATRRVFYSIIWYRLAFPFSCVVAALLGVSLSIVRENNSALRGFAIAIGIMVFYYVVSHLFVLLGKNGTFPPFLAGCLPTLVFAGWGGWALFEKR